MGTERFQFNPFGQFLLLAAVCVGSSMAGHMFFPGSSTSLYLIRTALTAVGTIVLAVGSERLLTIQFGPSVTLGLKPTAMAAAGFGGGVVGGFLLIALIGAGLWIFAPFHFERGTLSASEIIPASHNFFWSNFGEELVFRGYLLIALSRTLGLRIALAVIAFAFGLFHLPGLTGLAAVKMVLTTAACSYLFSAAFLMTGTLWSAIALHFVGNVVLHKISGLDGGSAVLKPVLHEAYPTSYDPGFWLFVIIPVMLAWLLFCLKPRLITSPTSARL